MTNQNTKCHCEHCEPKPRAKRRGSNLFFRLRLPRRYAPRNDKKYVNLLMKHSPSLLISQSPLKASDNSSSPNRIPRYIALLHHTHLLLFFFLKLCLRLHIKPDDIETLSLYKCFYLYAGL